MNTHRSPNGLKAPGKRLWRAVVDGYDLAEHERQLLGEAARVADVCDSLQSIVDAEGAMTADGERPHPALVELRQQRILFARLLVALRVPLGEEEAEEQPPRTQRRGIRGFYAGGAA